MSGPDSSPNFDWLSRGAEKQRTVDNGSDSSTSLADLTETALPEVAETRSLEPDRNAADEPVPQVIEVNDTSSKHAAEMTPAMEPETPNLMEIIQAVPDPVLNDSDGTTLIIKGRQPFDAPNDSMPPEQFSLPEPTAEPTGAFEKRPRAQATETESSETESHPDESGAHAGTLSPGKPEIIDEAVSAPPAEGVEDVPTDSTPTQADVLETSANDEPDVGEDSSATTIFQSLSQDDVPAAMAPPATDGTVLDEPAGMQHPGVNDQGHTEVLRSEDIAKAKESWPAFPSLTQAVDRSGSAMGPPSGLDSPSFSSAPQSGEVAIADQPMAAAPSRMFIILASYASAITIAFLALVMKQAYENGHPHQLESLPDIATQKEGELTYVPANSGLPNGHTLHFGERQRFGNILVEPLEIVREPVEFTHYSGDQNRKHPPTQPVWKLKIRLTNVSKDQQIAPLDRRLVLRWVSKSGQLTEFTNYYIAEQGTKNRKSPTVQLYRLPVDSDWDMVGQDLGKTLEPGESYETFLASAEEGFDALPDHLVWRVQIRKGYSKQGNGVTTIFQVAFRKDDIVNGA